MSIASDRVKTPSNADARSGTLLGRSVGPEASWREPLAALAALRQRNLEIVP
jgi:hypothetical protein